MKKLLSKTLRIFTLYSLVVLAASVPAYFYLVDSIWLEELDEHNEIVAGRAENELRTLQLTEAALAQSIVLWNKIQPGSSLKKMPEAALRPDSIYTVVRQNPYSKEDEIDRFRGLSRIIQINGDTYELKVETNVEETEETVAAIAVITLLFFLILVFGFLVLSRRMSVQLWKPFRSTLSRLKSFNLNNQTPVAFEKSDTLEFEELNQALSRLLEHSIAVYQTQKEFTENASHELQTPLAIMKNKLDLLLQKEIVTDRQYQLIEEVNRALTRVSRINRNLLLLAKIENRQFDDNVTINVGLLVHQSIEQLREHADNKDISIKAEIASDVIVDGNRTLTEILINNLLLNAIRHNRRNGVIIIHLTGKALTVSNSGTMHLNNAAIFKRFAKTSAEGVGSGLGLAIIKEVCSRHEWTVSYQFEESLHHFTVRF